MSQQNVAAIRGLYEAFNRGDFETMRSGFNPNFERFEPENSLYSEGNPYRGFEGSRDGVYSPRMRDFENWKTELQQIHDAGDFIITTGRYKARCKATGKDLSTQFCHILHLDGSGKIDRLEGYTDTLKEAEVAGRVQRLEHVRMEQPVM